MATILDDEDTVEAQTLSTSLDPYGQLVKMLMPRALCITIYDRTGMPLWLSDGCEGPDLLQLVEEALNSARSSTPDPEERYGFARSWDGDTAYVFILRDRDNLLGAVALSCRDSGSGSRPFSLLFGLLRPAVEVLSRELANQYSLSDSQKNPIVRDSELNLLLETTAANDGNGSSDDFHQLVENCVTHLDCAFGALLIPDKKITVCHSASTASRGTDAAMLERTQRHLFAWAQVQRRTLALNKAPPNSPLGALPFKILACPVRLGNEPVTGLLALFRPIGCVDFDTRQIRVIELMARRIAHVLQSAYDPATGLLTRAAFEQRARATLASSCVKGRQSIAYVDVDRLHLVNDNYGMHVGDEVLERIASVIRSNLPALVTGARISGDRFALFFPDTTADAAESVLQKLCSLVAELDFSHEGQSIALSMSFGVAAVPETKLPLSHALAAAEAACKAAKNCSRAAALNALVAHEDTDPTVSVATVTTQTAAVHAVSAFSSASLPIESPVSVVASTPTAIADSRIVASPAAVLSANASLVRTADDLVIAGSLREAIANDRFRMEAQPIVQLGAGGAARRFELLLRMIDASGESIAPGKFLSAAERCEVATSIDRWVVQYALEILSSAAPALQRLGAHFTINISGQSVGDEHFPTFLEEKLREYELPANLLSFEINETAAVANIVHAETLIRRLQNLGHDIALDDFGRGLSSLTYLKSLPVTDLKIDGELIRDLVGNARSQETVTAIVQLAQSMNLRTTAESVESEAILEAVGQLGLDYGQGFAIGRPKPLEVVLQDLLRDPTGAARASGSPFMARMAG
ncbi:MAG TPA: EAL domain-containing protein [Steroidobacteraceae bacterium]|jgi:diguanylate cyclase (GGDEF)-like protein